jgi:hypothetical protein
MLFDHIRELYFSNRGSFDFYSIKIEILRQSTSEPLSELGISCVKHRYFEITQACNIKPV